MANARDAGMTALGELEVHRLGFGSGRLAGKDAWGSPDDRDNAKAVLRRAVALGVDVIDTADSYGPHVAEELVADALYPYDGLVIATKGGKTRWGPGAFPEGWSDSTKPEQLHAACEGSLRRLRLDRIDLYLHHAPGADAPYAESIGALKELQDEGKIRHVGVCNVTLEQLDLASSIVDVVAVQNMLSLCVPTSVDVLTACEERGITFMAWGPLGFGALAAPGGPIAEAAARHQATAAQIALAWLLSCSSSTLPIPGTASLAHLEENIEAAALHLDEDEVAAIGDAAAQLPPLF